MSTRPAIFLSDAELETELTSLGDRWDKFRAALAEDEGHGGSPGEWMVERMCELETEQKRRKERKP